MRKYQNFILGLFLVLQTVAGFAAPLSNISGFFSTPETPTSFPELIARIQAAQKSVHVVMFHFSNPEVADALVQARQRGVDVQIILNEKDFSDVKAKLNIEKFVAVGIEVLKGSSAFSITHEKTMVIDGTTSVIMTSNLTTQFRTMRDFGIMTEDPLIARDMENLFQTDVNNSRTRGKTTPEFASDALVISPTNSRTKLISLINEASQELFLMVENFSDPNIAAALKSAAARSVKVKVVLPLCDFNFNPFFNVPMARELKAAGIDVRMMPAPTSAQTPYMHAKVIGIKNNFCTKLFLGSVNFSLNSLDKARELGVIIDEKNTIAKMQTLFDQDFAASVDIPDQTPRELCPKFK